MTSPLLNPLTRKSSSRAEAKRRRTILRDAKLRAAPQYVEKRYRQDGSLWKSRTLSIIDTRPWNSQCSFKNYVVVSTCRTPRILFFNKEVPRPSMDVCF